MDLMGGHTVSSKGWRCGYVQGREYDIYGPARKDLLDVGPIRIDGKMAVYIDKVYDLLLQSDEPLPKQTLFRAVGMSSISSGLVALTFRHTDIYEEDNGRLGITWLHGLHGAGSDSTVVKALPGRNRTGVQLPAAPIDTTERRGVDDAHHYKNGYRGTCAGVAKTGEAYPRALVRDCESGTTVTLTVLDKESDGRERPATSAVAGVMAQRLEDRPC